MGTITTLFISALLALMLSSGDCRAESTLIIELQQKLNSQSERFNERLSKLNAQDKSSDFKTANKWYETTRKLPKDAVDYQHAIAKYVLERSQLLESEIKEVLEMEQINQGLFTTIGQLIKALAEENKSTQQEQLTTQEYQQAKQNMQGMQKLVSYLRQDKQIAQRPDFVSMTNTYEMTMNRILDKMGNKQLKLDKQLQQVANVIEVQGELIGAIKEDLKQEFQSLKVLDISQGSTIVATRVNSMLNGLTSWYNGTSGQKIQQQTNTLFEESNQAWNTVPDNLDHRLSLLDDRVRNISAMK